MPAGASKGTPDGAASFAGYFWDVVNYSYEARRTDLLNALSQPGCTFCAEVAKEIEQRRSENATFVGARAKVTAAVAAPGDVRRGLIVNAMLEVTPGRTLRSDGSVLETFPAESKLPCDLAVSWDGKSWSVLDVSVDPRRAP